MLNFLTHVSGFIYKEIFGVLRQTRLVLTLLVGPFLILLLFGLGYRGEQRALRTLFIADDDSDLVGLIEEYATSLGSQIEFVGITDDADEATDRLRSREVDLVISVPFDPEGDILNNEQSTFIFYHTEIAPLETSYISVMARFFTDQLNEIALETAAEKAKDEADKIEPRIDSIRSHTGNMRQAMAAGDGETAQAEYEALRENLDLLTLSAGALALLGGIDNSVPGSELTSLVSLVESMQEGVDNIGPIDAEQEDFTAEAAALEEIDGQLDELDQLITTFGAIDSDVLVEPFASKVLSISEITIRPIFFYAPAVLALIVQHIAITFAALSITRERHFGMMELFQVAPISALEMLLGKGIGFLLLTGALAAALAALVVFLLNVPMVGSWALFAIVLLGVIVMSLGWGFAISIGSKTESQAVQYVMLTLLASVFFSGFFLPLYQFVLPVRLLGWLWPATYGTNLLQDVMLRDRPVDLIIFLALFAFGVILSLSAWLRLRGAMKKEMS